MSHTNYGSYIKQLPSSLPPNIVLPQPQQQRQQQQQYQTQVFRPPSQSQSQPQFIPLKKDVVAVALGSGDHALDVHAELARSYSENTQLKEKIGKLEREIQELKQRTEKLVRDEISLNETCGLVTKALEERDEKLTSTLQDMQALKNQCSKLDNEVTALQRQKKSLSDDLNLAQNKAIDEKKASELLLNNEIDSLKIMIQRLKNENDAVAKQLDETKKEAADAKKEAEEAEKEAEKVFKSSEEMFKEAKEAIKAMEKAQKEAEDAKKEAENEKRLRLVRDGALDAERSAFEAMSKILLHDKERFEQELKSGVVVQEKSSSAIVDSHRADEKKDKEQEKNEKKEQEKEEDVENHNIKAMWKSQAKGEKAKLMRLDKGKFTLGDVRLYARETLSAVEKRAIGETYRHHFGAIAQFRNQKDYEFLLRRHGANANLLDLWKLTYLELVGAANSDLYTKDVFRQKQYDFIYHYAQKYWRFENGDYLLFLELEEDEPELLCCRFVCLPHKVFLKSNDEPVYQEQLKKRLDRDRSVAREILHLMETNPNATIRNVKSLVSRKYAKRERDEDESEDEESGEIDGEETGKDNEEEEKEDDDDVEEDDAIVQPAKKIDCRNASTSLSQLAAEKQ